MYAVRKSRRNEHEIFAAYLADRLWYSLSLGLIRAMPTTTEGILETGADITFEQVESLFAAEVKSASHTPSSGRVRHRDPTSRCSQHGQRRILSSRWQRCIPAIGGTSHGANSRLWAFPTGSRWRWSTSSKLRATSTGSVRRVVLSEQHRQISMGCSSHVPENAFRSSYAKQVRPRLLIPRSMKVGRLKRWSAFVLWSKEHFHVHRSHSSVDRARFVRDVPSDRTGKDAQGATARGTTRGNMGTRAFCGPGVGLRRRRAAVAHYRGSQAIALNAPIPRERVRA